MGFFSFFSKSKTENEPKVISDYSTIFTKELVTDVVKNSKTMMLFFKKKEGWVGANKAFYDTTGLIDIEDMKQRYESIRDLFVNESEEVFTEDDKSWLDYIKKYKLDGYGVTMFDKKEEILYIEAKCYMIPSDKDFYILELHDVSKLHRAQEKTKEVERLKTKFLANIGHEFRTPMNGILGFVELLNQTNLDKRQFEYLHMISRSSTNLMANIESLLDLSQMQGGRLILSNSNFSISHEMEKISHTFQIFGKEKGINVHSFIDPKLPLEVNSDFRKINQIMSSLLHNAIKFTDRGGKVILEVKLLKKQLNGDCSIAFSVKDNGKGISNKEIAYITEPFHSGTQADERLGVGLSLAHGLAKLLDSDLKVKSEEGHGSYFSFVLNFKASKGQAYKMMPKKRVKVLLLDNTKIDQANFLSIYLRAFALDVVKANVLDEKVYANIDALYIVANQNDSSWMLKLGTFNKKVPIFMVIEEDEKLQTKLTHMVDGVVRRPLLPSVISKHLLSMYKVENKQERVEVAPKRKNSITALVVEDNLINQRLIQILLQEYKVSVKTAINGNEAVEATQKEKFDIVFMDIDMPEKNGILATKEIKNGSSVNMKTPIVALTAMAMHGDKEMILAEGLDDYMSKPLTREKLEQILDKYLKVSA